MSTPNSSANATIVRAIAAWFFALLIFFPISGSSLRIRPPRGPRRVLWVVVVTTWACGIGDGCRPAATKPAMCAMSTNR